MPKTEKILGYFPDHYYTTDPRKLIYLVVNALSKILQEDENHAVGILKSHWINTLEEIIDLRRMAALYSDLGEPYDDGVQQGRQRLQKIVRLFLTGPGTVRSMFEFSELVLARFNLNYLRDNSGHIILRDEDGNILFSEDESKHNFFTKAELKSANETFEVELVENPPLDKFFEQSRPLNRTPFFLNNNGFFSRFPKIIVTGIAQRTANFLILNISTGQAIGFRGSVPHGSTLTLIPDENGFIQEAQLNDTDVKDRVYSLVGGQFEKDYYDEQEQAIIAERRPLNTYDSAVFAGPEDSDPIYFQPPLKIRAPEIPLAESQWHIRVLPAHFDKSYFDESVYRIPEVLGTSYDMGRFDQAIYAIEPSARLRFEWRERERASFILKLPPEPFTTLEQIQNVLQGTKKIVHRVKAAGIKAEVKFKYHLWMLGTSILRDSEAAEGPGIDEWQTRV